MQLHHEEAFKMFGWTVQYLRFDKEGTEPYVDQVFDEVGASDKYVFDQPIDLFCTFDANPKKEMLKRWGMDDRVEALLVLLKKELGEKEITVQNQDRFEMSGVAYIVISRDTPEVWDNREFEQVIGLAPVV